MQQQPEPAPRTAPLALWRVARAFLCVLHDLFGAPADLAAQHTLTRKTHALIASWLRAGEAMLRRLLLIEAAALKEGVTHALADRQPAEAERPVSPSPARCAEAFSADDPDSWRVRFRCLLDRRRPRRRAAGAPRQEVRFRSAWPLAQRLEAMLRVFNTPLAYARRLARRLNAHPRRAGELLRAPPEYEHRVDCAATFNEEAERARRCWDSS